MKIRLLLVLSVVLAFGVAVSAVSAGEGSPRNPRKLCTKGSWQKQGFKSEDKCLSYLENAKVDCQSVGGTFGADTQTTNNLGKVGWTCNGDGVTGNVSTVLVPDCNLGWVFQILGTEGVPAFTCFRI